jgi:hypothetical protein
VPGRRTAPSVLLWLVSPAYVTVRVRARGNIRIKATFAGDSDHLGSTSPWSYARIT